MKKQWIYGAVNDNNFNNIEILNIVKNTNHIRKFICLNIKSILGFSIESRRDTYIFDNVEDDWKEILSGLNEYTLWDSIIFDESLNIFIIKPWSISYSILK
ncbi:hypothetical protein [Neisseria yangbaofengii]|uniref:hypothetical protein n=1 Tax=Neisseria yangbaofengii TaxID=2709396 RepID=UPI0013ED656F|nr:hypothetical protein [Neisseria yangbaofengii]